MSTLHGTVMKTELPFDSAQNALAHTDSDKPTIQDEGMFTLFPTLPLELREKIWESYEQQPRVINIYNYRAKASYRTNENTPLEVRLTFNERLRMRYKGIPLLLGVNMESRRVILRSYKTPRRGTGLFFNLSEDFFYFHDWKSYDDFLDFSRAEHVTNGHETNEHDTNDTRAWEGQVPSVEDIESQLRHFAIRQCNFSGHDTTGLTELERLKGLKTFTVAAADLGMTRYRSLNTFMNDSQASAFWSKKISDAKAWDAKKLPQVIFEKGNIISMNGSDRYWLTQSAEGEWAWNHGKHHSDSRHEGWGPEDELEDQVDEYSRRRSDEARVEDE